MTSIFDTPEFNDRIFFPDREWSVPADGASDRFVEVESGVRLHVRFYTASEPVAALLLFHGNGELIAQYDRAASPFAKVGARLIVMDYRGYGRSDGAPTFRNCLHDAVVVATHVRRSLDEEGSSLPLVVMGRSLGAASAAEIAGRNLDAVWGIVLESGAGDIEATVRRRNLPPTEPLSKLDYDDFDPRAKLARSGAPLLVLHAERDASIPVAEAIAAYEASGAVDKRLAIISDLGHNTLSLDPRYWQELRAFLARVAERALGSSCRAVGGTSCPSTGVDPPRDR